MKTPFSSMALVLIGSFIGSFGAVLLKFGANKLKGGWLGMIKSWQIAAGTAAYLLSSVFFVLGVRRGELTILYPLVSLGYVWTLFWAKMFFNEPLTRTKFAGLALIFAGIFVLQLGNR